MVVEMVVEMVVGMVVEMVVGMVVEMTVSRDGGPHGRVRGHQTADVRVDRRDAARTRGGRGHQRPAL